MSPRLICMAGLMALGGCATDWHRSYDRWYRYTAEPGPYRGWALCVEERAGHYLDPRGADRGIPGNRPQLFTNVLSDCREHMSDMAWSQLDQGAMRQLVADAYRAFFSVDAEIQANIESSISDTSR